MYCIYTCLQLTECLRIWNIDCAIGSEDCHKSPQDQTISKRKQCELLFQAVQVFTGGSSMTATIHYVDCSIMEIPMNFWPCREIIHPQQIKSMEATECEPSVCFTDKRNKFGVDVDLTYRQYIGSMIGTPQHMKIWSQTMCRI